MILFFSAVPKKTMYLVTMHFFLFHKKKDFFSFCPFNNHFKLLSVCCLSTRNFFLVYGDKPVVALSFY